ncbi:inner membrane transporter RhtA [Agromyces flavus]|uniref:Inner membrane transporter RhtA n=1 Tax=Agromyces flavus TaxID=589382 RepID=A0A1H1NSJ2_9MICO|nr:EamA family transporter [Agromyces flavus]MCP2368050.1 inner membrane transporter RhtA [Agromyces flavus]GGI47512.1 membrane protein [Agromyces flavus]SDS01946.1 inner membrane transporter RhtA [Agromyces flavus]
MIRQRNGLDAAAVVVGAASVPVGAALGATIFPFVGPAGVVALRQAFTALILLGVTRPRLRRLGWASVRPAIALGGVLVVMNLSVYAAVERIGLGPAVTLEFLGPLALALLASRRRLDLACAVVAGAGVVLLTGSVPGIDPLGILLGLTAAAAWAGYILLSQRAGRTLPGLQGTAIASLVAAVLTSPILVLTLVSLAPHEVALVLAIGAAAAVLSSALPYSIDLVVLRRMPRQRFGVLQSVHPAAAAIAGLVVLGETLSLWQVAGLVLVTLANAVAVGVAPGRPPAPQAARPEVTQAPRHPEPAH